MVKVETLYYEIPKNGDPVWNLDETSIDFTQKKISKEFTSKTSYHGDFKGSSTTNGIIKQIIAAVAISGSRRITPSFFIVTGKRVMSQWSDPIEGDIKTPNAKPEIYVKEESTLFPGK